MTTTTPTTTYTASYTTASGPVTSTVSAPAAWSPERVARTMRVTVPVKGKIELNEAEEGEIATIKLGE